MSAPVTDAARKLTGGFTASFALPVDLSSASLLIMQNGL
jgi:hypothetical protein